MQHGRALGLNQQPSCEFSALHRGVKYVKDTYPRQARLSQQLPPVLDECCRRACSPWPQQVCRAAAIEADHLHPQHVLTAATAAATSNFCQPLSFQNRHSIHDAQGHLMLKNLTLKELEEWCESIGESSKRALQLWRWMYYDHNWISSFQETLGRQNGLSHTFINLADSVASVDGGLLLQQVAAAQDGTKKLVFKLTEGEGAGGSVEAVLIPMVHRKGSRKHVTLCVSSQVGCAMNCQFCYTGRMGLSGNLSTAQIIEQMVVACRVLAADPAADAAITNVVFMGMGEPLHNYESVMAAVDIMCHPLGLHMSHNKVTVSTVGLADRLEQFATSSNVQLAWSLHATTDTVRDWIVPVNRRHNLEALTTLMRKHYGTGNSAGRRVLVEYTLLQGVNDSLEDAARLVQLLNGIEAKVNLIMFNPYLGTRFKRSPIDTALSFRSVLIQAGRICTIRDSRGDDEMAACGQLGNPAMSSKAAPILEPLPEFLHALEPPLT